MLGRFAEYVEVEVVIGLEVLLGDIGLHPRIRTKDDGREQSGDGYQQPGECHGPPDRRHGIPPRLCPG